ncbi:hypothetical protein NST81_02860 [Bacillus sp. FSL W8-0223]|uniref:hypothetical protein n=1 Tax=Bacillus sp. FSL W8-0223 TaxID=2954595 RepID=UPI0030FA05D1
MVNFLLWSEVLFRILSVITLISLIASSGYSIKLDSDRKKEINRLRELNDEIALLMDVPVKKAKEFLQGKQDV